MVEVGVARDVTTTPRIRLPDAAAPVNEHLVEASLVRPAVGFVAEMPFAKDAGCVPGTLKDLRDRGHLEGKPLAFEDRVGDPVLELVPPGQERGPGRRTRRTDVEVGEPHSLRVKLVEVRRHEDRVAVGRDIAVPLVVGQHEDDVRLLAGERLSGLCAAEGEAE
jgi:hypothetical protein